MRVFSELAALVESRWRDQNYNEQLFPGTAAQALVEINPGNAVDPWDIIRWVHTTAALPQQMDLAPKFGNPPITVYVGPRFYIDVYFWLDGTTTIHQHAFSGAFQVLLGSSVHSNYSFEKRQEFNPHFLAGKLELNNVSLLEKGDIREIAPGPEFIHSLFHLERPSATIVIRSYKAPASAVQFRYLKPFLALDPNFTNASLKRNAQTVELLFSMNHPEVDRFVGELLDSSDFQTAHAVLEQAFNSLCHCELEEMFGFSSSSRRFQALVDRARRKHGELVDLLQPVFEEKWRQKDIIRRRALIKREDHRLFLALLLNVPDRTRILSLVNGKHPDKDPAAVILEWITELSRTKVFSAPKPSVLGIGDFNDNHRFVFQGLLEGLTVEQMKARATTQPAGAMLESSVEDAANRIRGVPLFTNLFTAE